MAGSHDRGDSSGQAGYSAVDQGRQGSMVDLVQSLWWESPAAHRSIL